MLPNFAYFEGKIVPYAEAKVGVATHALNYGTGAFAGIRAYWNEEENQLWRVLEYQHIKVARGGATIRLKVRNVRSGSTVERTYSNGTRVNDVELDKDEVQYLYKDTRPISPTRDTAFRAFTSTTDKPNNQIPK